MIVSRYPLAEICLDSLVHNLGVIRGVLQPKCKILGVVKAEAYGHGALAIAKTLLGNGAYMLGTASFYEGMELRQGGISSPILLFSQIQYPLIPSAIESGLTLTVHSRPFLERVLEESKRLKKTAKIHIKVNTGMGRLGFLPEEALNVISSISHAPSKFLFLEGVYTHLASAEVPSDSFTLEQIHIFVNFLENIDNTTIPIVHAANSAGIFNYPQSHFDMVRPGISLYGVPQNKGNASELREIITWKTRFTQIKWLPEGSTLSYGATFVTRRKSLIGTLRIGYGDGYNRLLSNCGEVLVRGRRFPVVGRVCMDLCLVDLTEFPEVTISDEVVLLGRQGREEITSSEIAALCKTISYEVFCNIGKRTFYLYKENGKITKTRKNITTYTDYYT